MTVKVSKPAINVREELADLKKPTGIAGQAMLAAETPQEQFNLIGAGRKNILINGAMEISQRGDFSSEADAANDSFQLDRWKLRNSGVAADVHVNVVTDDLPPVIKNGYALRCRRMSNAPNSQKHFGHRQFIEDYAKYGGMTLTYSAWVKSNIPMRLWIFEAGGSGNSAESESHPADGNWHLLQVSKVITDNITSLTTYLTPYGQHILQSDDYHLSTLHQMEIGKVATPFEHPRSYGEELALCQRFFQKHDLSPNSGKTLGQFHTANQFVGPFEYPVTMRAIPTFTGISYGAGSNYVYSGGAYKGAPTTFNQDTINQSMVLLRVSGGTLSGTVGVAGVMYGLVFSLDAEL